LLLLRIFSQVSIFKARKQEGLACCDFEDFGFAKKKLALKFKY